MTLPISDPTTDTCAAIRAAILDCIPGATIDVSGAGGHFTIRVVSNAFEDKSMLEQQRLVYGAITALMSGADAPVHAVDKLETLIA